MSMAYVSHVEILLPVEMAYKRNLLAFYNERRSLIGYATHYETIYVDKRLSS